MNETTIGDAIIFGIDKLSTAIKTIAPELWRIYVHQQYICGGLEIFFGVTNLIGARLLYNLLHKKRKLRYDKNREYEYSEWESDDASTVLTIMGIVITIILGVLLLGFGVYRIMTPEYHAIQAMMYVFK